MFKFLFMTNYNIYFAIVYVNNIIILFRNITKTTYFIIHNAYNVLHTQMSIYYKGRYKQKHGYNMVIWFILKLDEMSIVVDVILHIRVGCYRS